MAGRNANGEGSVYKRKDGRWEGAVYVSTVSGRSKRVRVYGVTRAEAHTKLMAAIAEAQRGILVPDRIWRMDDYLDHWLTRAKCRPLTHRRHETVVRLYLKPGIGKQKLNTLSVRIIQDFLDQLQDDGKPVATIHQVRKVPSAALTYAMRREILQSNPARLVELSRYRPKEAEHWTADETAQFLGAAKLDPLYPAFVLLALYGLRRGEVLGIRWRDVDFEQQLLHIRQQVQRIDGSLQQVDLKTDSSLRDMPLLPTARDVLMVVQRAKQAADRAAAGAQWRGVSTRDELVFTTKTGRPLESRNLYRSFLRICAEHGIRRITIHGIRHTNATTQKSLQVHDRDIQATLGHGDVRTTGIYEHVDLESKRRALSKVEGTLFEDQFGYKRARCRQKLPSNHDFVDVVTSFTSGGASQTRTGDTRLFRPIDAPLQDQLTSIEEAMQARARLLKLGCVAVYFTVNYKPPASRSWRDVELPKRSPERSS